LRIRGLAVFATTTGCFAAARFVFFAGALVGAPAPGFVGVVFSDFVMA
jgi:hypothetical protein